MKVSQALKLIPKHKWWSEQASGNYAFISNIFRYCEQAKYWHPKYLSSTIFFYKDGQFYENSPFEEKLEIYYWLFKKVKRDKKYLNRFYKKRNKLRDEFLRQGKNLEKNISSLDNKTLWKVFSNFIEADIDFVRFEGGTECVDVFSENEAPKLIQEANPQLDLNKCIELAITLSAPAKLSFMEQYELLLFRAALDKKNKDKYLKQLTKKYFWIANNYLDAKILTTQDFKDKIKTLRKKHPTKEIKKQIKNYQTKAVRLKKAKKKIYQQYNFSADLKLHFYLVSFLGSWIDQRKSLLLQSNHFINCFCLEITKRFNLKLDLVKFYTLEEFKNLLLNNKTSSLAAKRKKFTAQITIRQKNGWQSKDYLFYGPQADKIFKAFYKIKKTKTLVGQVASAPVKKITGKVQIILDPNRQKFTPGNILVTTMTRPDFLPLMRQAKAVITDEGGLTCHAAIISRELNLPCLIGTKTATKILTNNAIITLDLTKGIIQK